MFLSYQFNNDSDNTNDNTNLEHKIKIDYSRCFKYNIEIISQKNNSFSTSISKKAKKTLLSLYNFTTNKQNYKQNDKQNTKQNTKQTNKSIWIYTFKKTRLVF